MEIPAALIATAELLDAQGSVRLDDAPEEMHLLCRLGFAEKVQRKGPQPEPPKQSIKLAHELRPGDLRVRMEKSYRIAGVAHSSIGDIPHPAIVVNADGCRLLPYEMRARVKIADGPIREAETWQEYQLKAEAKDWLQLWRLTKRHQDAAAVGPETAEWLGDGKVRVGEHVFTLEPRPACVLQVLVELGSATKPQLENRSRASDAVTVLKRMCRQFPALACHIFFPGGRGKGGYRTTIINRADPPAH